MSLSYKDSTRNARLDRLTTDLGATAVIEIYSGAPAGKTSGTFNADPAGKLATLTLSNPIAPGSSAGVLTLSAIASAAATGSGTPASFRLKTVAAGGTSTVIVEGDAAVGSGSLNFSSGITVSGTVSITSATITEGNP